MIAVSKIKVRSNAFWDFSGAFFMGEHKISITETQQKGIGNKHTGPYEHR